MLPRLAGDDTDDVEGTDLGTGVGVGLLSDQQGIPRQSEEEEVWRRA